MAVSISSPPSYWTHKSLQAYPTYFLEDAPGTMASMGGIIKSTWDQRVVGVGKDAVKLKHLGIKIVGVKRVENCGLFTSYIEKRQEFVLRQRSCPAIQNIPEKLANFYKSKTLPEVNEYYLFHGTDEGAAVSIAAKGFQTRMADSDNLFGKGIYFSDSFQKADQYSDDPDNRKPPGTQLTVIMARVLLGYTYECDKENAEKLTCPPYIQNEDNRPDGSGQRYDSVESTGLLFREFVVYDRRQCYPEYIITYTRSGKKKIPRQDEVSKSKSKKIRLRNKPKRNNPAITWQQAVRSISATLDGHAQANSLTKLTYFWQKTKTDRPEYEFKENRRNEENRWECVCRIHFPIESKTATGRRKKIAKRLAAEEMIELLKSLLETNLVLAEAAQNC